jgi:hypothetical protein
LSVAAIHFNHSLNGCFGRKAADHRHAPAQAEALTAFSTQVNFIEAVQH